MNAEVLGIDDPIKRGRRDALGAMWNVRLRLVPYLVGDAECDPEIETMLRGIDNDLVDIARAIDTIAPTRRPR